jgi:surface polysaccharide O-acyltransferase-like enzyme
MLVPLFEFIFNSRFSQKMFRNFLKQVAVSIASIQVNSYLDSQPMDILNIFSNFFNIFYVIIPFVC